MSNKSERGSPIADLASPTDDRNITVTVNSVMQGVPKVVISIHPRATLRELKLILEQKSDVASEKQLLMFNGKELKDENQELLEYGIVDKSTVVMNVRMSTGTLLPNSLSAASMILFVPVSLPENKDSLRQTLKTMTKVVKKAPKKVTAIEKTAAIWTPEKQLEAELTRNRMKGLLKKRKTILSGNITPLESAQTSTGISPISTPPEWNAPDGTPLKSSPTVKDDEPVTEKELKLFYDPPETMVDLERARHELVLPPQNQQELDQIRARISEQLKTSCAQCKRKLPATQQTMKCKCQRVFCDRHRDPIVHHCTIDYKQQGRIKLKKENAKVGEGARKAKFDK